MSWPGRRALVRAAEAACCAAMIVRGLALPLATYRRRRRAALKLLQAEFGQRVPLLLLGCDETALRRDRQDPWFDYFAGCHEPDAALLLDPSRSPADTLFLDPGDPSRVVWDGPRLKPDDHARRAHGVGAVAAKERLADAVALALHRSGGLIAMCHRSREPGFQAAACDAWKAKLGARATVLNAEAVLAGLRVIKDADEVAWHRKAIAITAAGLKTVLPRIPSMRSEAEVASALTMHYRSPAYGPLAFPPIVGSAGNGATLHYPFNDRPLAPGQPLLIDSGATAGGYCADVTRTIPQHGRFDDRRFREVYELVLRCNALGRKHARPGITFDELNRLAWQPIIDAGFTRHHGLSHFIGLDVHDPGDRSRPLAPGMIISNEPGVYLPDEGFGIRIEDDLLITRDGCEELTAAIPKDVRGIERWMAA
jgi:Xaa-Pro aminopeptidase